MKRPMPDEVRRANFIHACLSTGIPLAEAKAMLAAHEERSTGPISRSAAGEGGGADSA